MKFKHLVVFGIIILPSFLFAQDEVILKQYFPHKEKVMFELNFNPFSQTGAISFENFQTKYWLGDKMVLRMGLQMKNKVNLLTDEDYDPAEKYKMNVSEKSLLFGVKPGLEFRFLKNSRISPYAGFEVQYKNKSTSSNYREYFQTYNYSNGEQTTKYEFVETKIDGGQRNVTTGTITTNAGTFPITTTGYTGERAFSSLGGNLLVGSDFYFVRNMYFGFEAGFGYESLKYKQVVVDISNNVKKTTIPSLTNNNAGFYYNSAIRLGIWF